MNKSIFLTMKIIVYFKMTNAISFISLIVKFEIVLSH